MTKSLKLARIVGVLLLVGASPIGVLLYFALAYESVAAMILLGVIASITLMVLGSTITLVGQHVHAKLNAGLMTLNMQENSALMRAYSSAMSAAANVRKADDAIQKQNVAAPEISPALIIDQDAFSEIDAPYHEAL